MKIPLLISLMVLNAITWSVAGEMLPPIHSRTLDEATRSKVLLINEGNEPRTLDPQAAAMGPLEQHIIMGLIEGLVGCHLIDQSKEVLEWPITGNTTTTIQFGPFISAKTINGPMVIQSLLRISFLLTNEYRSLHSGPNTLTASS